MIIFTGAGGGTRTRTPKTWQGILSPWCLPFHHSGCVRIVYHKFRRSRSLRCGSGRACRGNLVGRFRRNRRPVGRVVPASRKAVGRDHRARRPPYCTTTTTLKNRIAAFSAAVAPSTNSPPLAIQRRRLLQHGLYLRARPALPEPMILMAEAASQAKDSAIASPRPQDLRR